MLKDKCNFDENYKKKKHLKGFPQFSVWYFDIQFVHQGKYFIDAKKSISTFVS